MARKLSQLAMDNRWQVEGDVRTLREAQEVMADKKRLAAAKAEAERQIKQLEPVAKKPAPMKKAAPARRMK